MKDAKQALRDRAVASAKVKLEKGERLTLLEKEMLNGDYTFVMLDHDIVKDPSKVNKNELLAYVAITYYADENGDCFPSYESIAKIMRASRTTAINAVQGLVKKGIINLENRKVEDKKKELTSNLYTVIDRLSREGKSSENRKYILTKNMEYTRRVKKGKVTKLQNQLDKEKAPNSIAVELDAPVVQTEQHFNQFDNNSIPQEVKEFKAKPCNKLAQEPTKNVKMLQDADIQYVPFKQEVELIESLESDILEKAIEKTLEKSTSRSWNYLLPCYDTIAYEKYNPKQEQPKASFDANKVKLKGGLGQASATLFIDGEYIKSDNVGDKFTPSEFNDYIEKMNKAKWGIA